MNLFPQNSVYMSETGFHINQGGEDMDPFETMMAAHRPVVERFVKFRLPPADADDVLQEVWLTAYQKQGDLRSPDAAKAWLLSIARSKCGDYFRAKTRRMELPLDALTESALSYGRQGVTVREVVRDTLDQLGGVERQVLYLYYFRDLPQAEIAARLGVPLGTVKSRLSRAKAQFREVYPYPPSERKGEILMTKLPKYLPAYDIVPSALPPFPVKWEEIMGWFIVPKPGERLSWGMYDYPERIRSEYTEMAVVGRAEVHGIAGVEIAATQYTPRDHTRDERDDAVERRFIAQLTDTHCRCLAESHVEAGVRKHYTFLDGDAFLDNWGFGPDNCGNETNLAPKGIIQRRGTTITCPAAKDQLDVVGRYTVTINGKPYDTVCVMDVECYEDGVATEQFLDAAGRTILWRRFNRDDWALSRYGRPWSEQLPDNARLTINGDTYVHWYDCITDYIL